MIAACLAYIWIIYLGNLSKKEGWDKIIHRTKQMNRLVGSSCDLSLFQLGLRLLDYFLNQEGEPLAGSPWKFLLPLIGLNKMLRPIFWFDSFTSVDFFFVLEGRLDVPV